MRLAGGDHRFRVYDDVLPPEQFADVWRYVEHEQYEPVHARRWSKVWRLSDGMPFRGPLVMTGPPRATGDRTTAPYPTGNGIDRLIAALLEEAHIFGDLVGAHGVDWDGLTASATLYPVSTGLSWHLDGGSYTGAFTYYAHAEWNCQWGGELLVADLPPRPPGARLFTTPAHLRNAQENDVLSAIGMGTYIAAKPNRLVVLRRGTAHKVQRVDPAAGDRVRATISGFFLAMRPARPEPDAAT